MEPLWVEKYRPQNLSQYVFQNQTHKDDFEDMINTKTIPHLLLSGVRGTGKTTIARILINHLDIDPNDILTINGSSNRGIDTFRDKIENFALAIPIGRFKIVHIEEADRFTPDAQKALKAFTEDVSDYVRFIFSCNNVNSIISELRSRCAEYYFKAANINDITARAAEILIDQQVKWSLTDLDLYVNKFYPDIRKIINVLQQNCKNQVLRPFTNEVQDNTEFEAVIKLINQNNWIKAREVICENVTSDQWEQWFTMLYKRLNEITKFNKNQDYYDEAIIIIAEHLYKHNFVADSEINFTALMIKLSHIGK